MMAKPATAFPGFGFITVILSYVFASNCSLNRRKLRLFFFADFLMVRALLVK